MSPDEIRDLLADEYNWDIEEMARDHRITVHDITGLLQCGGEGWQKKNAPQAPVKPRASYNVAFAPMVNVQFTPEDPCNLTEKEMDEVISLAVISVADNFGEKISAENLSMIRLYKMDGDEPGTERNHYIFTTESAPDPQILVEVTDNLYKMLYDENQDFNLTSQTIIEFARNLTEKYRNTDWRDEEHDFWFTIEQECFEYMKKQGKKD